MKEAILYLFSAIGLISSLITIINWIIARRKYTWEHFDATIKKLVDEMTKDHFQPSIIIGIGRGGAIVGGLVSEHLGAVPLFVFDHYMEWRDNKRYDCLVEEIMVESNLDSVLITTGVMHTGKTAELYYNDIISKGASKVKVLAFVSESHPQFRANYYEKMGNPKVNLPWVHSIPRGRL